MDALRDKTLSTGRGRKAKRSSLACLGCKRTKRKCDIAEQLPDAEGCTNCSDKGESCEVRYGEDKRRKRGIQTNSGLESRISQLEGMVAQKQFASHQDAQENQYKINWAEQALAHIEPLHASPTKPREQQAGQYGLAAQKLQFIPTSSSARLEMSAPHSTPQTSLGVGGDAQASLLCWQQDEVDASPGRASLVSSSATTHADESSTIMDKVISREGTLENQSDVHPSYFGPTSIHHLSTASQAFGRGRDQRQKTALAGPAPDIAPELDTSNEPEPVVTHLVDLFWTWQAAYLQVIHKPLFLTHKKLYDIENPRRRYDFFSPALLWAIMSLGSMVSKDRGIRYQSTTPAGVAGDKYFEKAKVLFEKDLGQPSITSVQTALLLGSRHGAVGQHSLGWLYSGLAIRMAIEMGLYLNCDSALSAGQLTEDMVQVRKLVFWGCYVQDKLWSAYTGRPSLIMDWDITLSRPGMFTGVETSCPEPRFMLSGAHSNIVILTIECSNIFRELYSQKHAGCQGDLRNAANSIHESLLKWHSSLPETLQWPNKNETPTSQHVLLMHMQFYFTLLLLHRPFIDFKVAAASINQLEDLPLNPIGICTLAATNITKLSRDYSFFYDLRQIPSPTIHFVFIAATIHLLNHRISGDDNHEVLFQGCLSGLADMAESYPNAQKALSVLQGLLQQLQSSSSSQTCDGNDSVLCSRTSRERKFLEEQVLDSHFHPRKQTRSTKSSNLATGTLFTTSLQNEQYSDNRPVDMDGSQANGSFTAWSHQPGSFDWSSCNSPITFPPSLKDIDIDSFTFPSQNSGYPEFLGPPINPSTTPGMRLSNDLVHVNNVYEALEIGKEPATAFLNHFYGTAVGLNQDF